MACPSGCPDCTTQPSGGVWTCEDGVPVYVPRPNDNKVRVLTVAPGSALPYWEDIEVLRANPIPPGQVAAGAAAAKPPSN